MNLLSNRFQPLLNAPSPSLRVAGWILVISVLGIFISMIAFLIVEMLLDDQPMAREWSIRTVGLCGIAASVSLAAIGLKLLVDPVSAKNHPELVFLRWFSPLLVVVAVVIAILLFVVPGAPR